MWDRRVGRRPGGLGSQALGGAIALYQPRRARGRRLEAVAGAQPAHWLAVFHAQTNTLEISRQIQRCLGLLLRPMRWTMHFLRGCRSILSLAAHNKANL